MRERGGPFIRTLADANRVAQLGMLRGAGLGAALGLPVGVVASLLGSWLETSAEEPHPAWVLTILFAMTGGFIGAVWMGQSDLMRDWPKHCRDRVWAEWRMGLKLMVPAGLPVAALLGWLCWREVRLVSVGLGLGLEVLLLFAGFGTLLGYYRGERSVRRFLTQAGYAHFGWFQYGTPADRRDTTGIIDDSTNVQEVRPGGLGSKGGRTMTARFCDGRTRRDFLRLGSAGVFGMGLTLPALLAAQARAAAPPSRQPARREVSVIYLFLHGGLSTIDTWDMKPDAPDGVRGEFKPIRTNVPGIVIGEHLPKTARVMDKISLIRSFRHHNSDHGAADHYMLTGYFPTAGFNPGLTPNNQRPAHGAIIARVLGPRGSVPPYVCLPKLHPSCGSAYLGAGAAPFVIDADPNAPDFSVPDVVPPPVIAASRLDDRRRLLAGLDRFHRAAEERANPAAGAVAAFRQKAFDLMTSPQARQAFDIHSENDRLRDAYGRNTLGQSCLMARRLVQAGVRCVTVDHSNWDTHDDNFATLKRQLLPALDAGLSTLFTDLAERGLLESTLVVITGEFGRTPRINKNAGRDHWGPAFTVALGGGGVQGGRVLGRSDARAERPAGDPWGPEDLSATICHLLGIDPKEELLTPEGRPVALVNNGRVLRDLL